ncbi:MAG TPA: exodeoxyribonuclease III, partial [Saprospiraceae bacterium]|nr:exodeoxyribonuclease III [Saprospiraceae bacterium]
KAHKEQLDLSVFEEAGYSYNYWFSAQKKGYSGVAVLAKKEPNKVVYGTGIETMDFEGRNLRLDFDGISVMSLYLPSGTSDARLAFKLNYMDEFLNYINELKQKHPNLVICGDYNICHQPIDIHDPVRLKNVSGFLPVEREWLTKFIASGFVDSFRLFNHEPNQYSWWSYRGRARERNKGWRLDYNMVSKPLESKITRAAILSDAVHSDHCPVLVEINV